MSQYVRFFLRVDDKFVELRNFSRSSRIYGAVEEFAPYGKVRPLTSHSIKMAIESLEYVREHNEEMIKQIRAQIKSVYEFRNSAEEKLEIINGINSSLDDIDRDNQECAYEICFLELLRDMIEDQLGRGTECMVDPFEYIYAGVDCDDPPEVESENLK